jgi:hypothetical protein
VTSPARSTWKLALALALPAAALAPLLIAACAGDGGGGAAGFSHDRFFVVTASHQGFACEKCHDPAAASFSLAGTRDAGPPGVECRQCHLQADLSSTHGGMAGYAWDCATCITCHKDGKTARFDHTGFPIAQGSPHQNIACADCHGPTRAVADLGCVTCHSHAQAATDAAHASVAGYQYASPACYGCHKDGRGGLPANHDADLFPVTGTPHASVSCSACHGATRALADLKCLGCHAQADMASRHAAVPASTSTSGAGTIVSYQYALAACMRCHADGRYTIAQHTGIISGDGHRPFCLVCHQAMRPAGGTKPWGANFAVSTCLACHSSNSPGGG